MERMHSSHQHSVSPLDAHALSADRNHLLSTPQHASRPLGEASTPINQLNMQTSHTPLKRQRTNHAPVPQYTHHHNLTSVSAAEDAFHQHTNTARSKKASVVVHRDVRSAGGSRPSVELNSNMRRMHINPTPSQSTELSMPSVVPRSVSPRLPSFSTSPQFRLHEVAGSHRPSFSLCRPSPELSQDTDITFISRRIITEFREISELGSGHFGHVTLYEEMTSGDYVAVKMSLPLTHSEMLLRARRERDILNALRGFPHVIRLYASWEEGKVPMMHLQMQYCPNGSVASIAQKRRLAGERWSELEVRTFLAQMALALDAIHSVRVVHVDFKPDNVLMDEFYNFVLTDFGCSLLLDENGLPRSCQQVNPSPAVAEDAHHHPNHGNNPNTATFVRAAAFLDTHASQQSHDEGDKRYISHDMMNEKKEYRKGDVFSLGISMYELMSGKSLPLSGDYYRYLRRRTELHELEEAGYTKELCHLVLQMMQFEPQHRPTTREILQAPLFRLGPEMLTLSQHIDTNVLVGQLDAQVETMATVKYQQACFEVTSYLLEAAVREHLHAYPATCRRLLRGTSLQSTASEGISPLRGVGQSTTMRMTSQSGTMSEVSFRTPTMRPL